MSIARTEALIAGWGMDQALRRAEAYRQAGADAILIHSKLSRPDEILESEGAERLETIGRTVRFLHQSAGLPIERIVPTRNGTLSVAWEDTGIRLFQWIDAQAFVPSDEAMRQAFRLLAEFHAIDLKTLHPELYLALARYSTPFGLERVVAHTSSIGQFLSNERAGIDRSIVDGFAVLAAEAELLVERMAQYNHASHLCHLAFHAKNLLVQGDTRLFLVDFDNLLIESPLKCLAFALLRFARLHAGWSRREFSPYHLVQFVDNMSPVYFGFKPNRETTDAIYFWMKFLEVEKTFRILVRIMQTSAHTNYLANITNTHLPNFEMLRSMDFPQ